MNFFIRIEGAPVGAGLSVLGAAYFSGLAACNDWRAK